MTIPTSASLLAVYQDYLARADLAAEYPTCVGFFEAEVNRTLRTRQMEATTLLYPVNSFQFTVTNAANNGSGLIRLTFTSTMTSTAMIAQTLQTGTEVFVQNVGGTTEANNTWIATYVSTSSIDLQNSTFANAYTSGGQFTNLSGYAVLPSDFLAVRRVTWSGEPNRELEYVQPSALRIMHPIVHGVDFLLDSDFPSVYTIEGSNIIVRPVDPTALEFDYYQQIPTLTAGSTATNWLLQLHGDAYLAGVLTEAYIIQKDWDQAGLWKQRRDDILDRIRGLDNKSRVGVGAAIKHDLRGRIP